jgi:hypothetical protein
MLLPRIAPLTQCCLSWEDYGGVLSSRHPPPFEALSTVSGTTSHSDHNDPPVPGKHQERVSRAARGPHWGL